jgi:hypothetical protein
LIGGGQFSVDASFTRAGLPMHFHASLTAVSEIAPSSLGRLDTIGQQIFEQSIGNWKPTWVAEIEKFDAHPLDGCL